MEKTRIRLTLVSCLILTKITFGSLRESLEKERDTFHSSHFPNLPFNTTKHEFQPSETILHKIFAKGEQMWLTREKNIESLWINGKGAEPNSPSGIAYAFNVPNSESLWVSNTSILLEEISQAYVKEFSHENFLLRRKKRQAGKLDSMVFWNGQNLNSRFNVKKFVRAQDYIANCGIKEENNGCNPSSRYRSYNGWCNNLQNPSLGKSVTPFDRMLPPVYDDGISIPRRRSSSGTLLPSPRYISSIVHVDVSHLSQKHNLLFMQYAQFLDHDITFTPVNRGPGDKILNCRECDSRTTVHPECWPIVVPSTDSYYPASSYQRANGKDYCIPFTRSLAGQQNIGPRQQLNQNSAYFDSSQIYGENYCKSMSLRGENGMLNITRSLIGRGTEEGKALMPQITLMRECRSPSGYCFHAGDSRANEQPALASVHTIYLREHNRIASNLHNLNPHWSDEKIYQESRRILIAINQHVAYSEFLPRLIGTRLINAYGLNLASEGYYAGYDKNCRGSVYNEFATSAFRFGHSLIRPNLSRMDNRYSGMNGYIPLRESFFNTDMLYKTLMVDEIIRGLLSEPMESMDPFVTKEVTNHLFEDRKTSFSGLDLVALNLHRGRDHGLQGYNSYRAACGLKRAKNFNDLRSEIPSDVITRLSHVYESVDDIDLFTGSMVEKPVTGGVIGPTIGCIIGNQFKRLRQCDRFWYETNDPLLRFTPTQLNEIRKATLSKIICENFDYPSEIQKMAFDAPHNVLNPRLPCNRLPNVNLEAWRENPVKKSAGGCFVGGRTISPGDAALSSPCVSCICTKEGIKRCSSLKITSCSKLMEESRLEDVLRDPVCTSQCSDWLNYRNRVSSEVVKTRFPSESSVPQSNGPHRFSITNSRIFSSFKSSS